jgi:hypothetical protein
MKTMFFFCDIPDIESKLRQIEDDPEGAGTAHLYEVTQQISSVANRAFQPLFERQVRQFKLVCNIKMGSFLHLISGGLIWQN